ncbi:MAG: Fic family protein [Cytophagales bacterium]|nr:Fic family protein [Cytophagales bacterium]
MMELIEKIAFSEPVKAEINRRLSTLDNYKVKWNSAYKNIDKKPMLQLRHMATVESVGSSTRIEGSTLTDAEVNTLLKDLHIQHLESRDEQEAAGYYEVLEMIETSYADISLSENIILQLHTLLLRHSSKDQRHKGAYKYLSNKVVANYPDGAQRVIFRTTEPHLTTHEMYDLISWTNIQLKNKELHPVLVVAVFVFEFLSIHPFQDGNGRLSRLLTTLLLLQAGYQFIEYISFENHIESHKDSYYNALMNGQKNRNTPHERIDEWLLFFTESLVILTEKLNVKLAALKPNGTYITERQKRIIAVMQKQGMSKMVDIATAMKKVHIASLKKDMAYLVKHGKVLKYGELKASVYKVA